jgi:hypothetical protein
LQDLIVKRALVIAFTSDTFKPAVERATQLAKAMGVTFDMRGLELHHKGGLTFPEAVCAENGFEYPCYVARGRHDDGVYLSVEDTRGYPELTQDKYIVVAASGDVGSQDLTEAVGKVRAAGVADAYIRTVDVYVGCLH